MTGQAVALRTATPVSKQTDMSGQQHEEWQDEQTDCADEEGSRRARGTTATSVGTEENYSKPQ